MRFPIWGLLFSTLLLTTGCGEANVVGGTPRSKQIAKVISLSPGTTEIVATFAADRLAGRTSSCNFPPDVTKVPVVCGVKPDYEKITAEKPDLIVYDAALFNTADIEKLKQSTQAELMAFEGKTLNTYRDWLYRLGAKLGTETAISEYLDKIWGSGVKASASSDKPTIAILMVQPGAEYMSAGSKSFLADVVKSVGGELVGPDADRFVVANVETLIQLNPDSIITAGGEQAGQVLKDPRLANIKAVKNKKIGGIDPDILLRTGARVDQLTKALGRFLGIGTK